MTEPFTTPDVVRAMIARCWLGAEALAPSQPSDGDRLGDITLRPHQSDAVRQIGQMLDEYGGAILADAVGLGKTYVALALARRARVATVVCPAALRDMWRQAAEASGVQITTTAMEAMSRWHDGVPRSPAKGAASPESAALSRPTTHCHDERIRDTIGRLVIVDEAHHFRNPHTRRFRALARETAGARVMLLTATPIHNRAEDLAAVLSLFLGARAWTLPPEDRATYIVRRSHEAIGPASGAIPRVIGPHVVSVGDDRDTLDAIVALPPAVPPRDGHSCSALTAMGLLRQWASSAGALRAALRRRLDRAAAIESALEQRCYPSYRDLRDWCLGEGTIQLALPEILLPVPSSEASTSAADLEALLGAVRAHAGAVRSVLHRLGSAPDLDLARAERLREIARTHTGARIVAFSMYEDTVRALFRVLRDDGSICALTAAGGLIAGGRFSRAEAIRQLGPQQEQASKRAERIGVLLTTDLLSEGVNLQAASVVVHLDLPWTPARLEQRVGRIARLGSTHRCVHVYALAPPATTERLLGVERRLRAKLEAAGRALGIAGAIIPPVAITTVPHAARSASQDQRAGPPEHLGEARGIVMAWQSAASEGMPLSAPRLACVRGPAGGFLAAVVAGGRSVLVASTGGPATDAPDVIAAAARAAGGPEARGDPGVSAAAQQAVRAWWAERSAERDAGLTAIRGAAPRLRVLGRIAAITRRAPMVTRPAVLALGERARRAAVAPFGSGAEWVLDQLASAPLQDLPWLRAIAAFGDAYAARTVDAAEPDRHLDIRALMVFV